ncbi:MAG: GGDEF domain-containing protein [Frankiaceae bacterium]|nr:GGDEF domain-containing protein [Frankiaceae bacterium]
MSVRRDQVAEQRQRPAHNPVVVLTEPEREEYEQKLDAYEVMLAEYRSRSEEYDAQLEAAHHDGLTGAWLRHGGRQLLEEELRRADRHGTPLSIAFTDVDGLKARNDQFGHAAGDQALITVARALLVGLRGYDHVIRWGGDEFLCVLPGLTQDEAVRRMEQVRGFLAAGDPRLSISVGIAERETGEGLDALVTAADRALYSARGRQLP